MPSDVYPVSIPSGDGGEEKQHVVHGGKFIYGLWGVCEYAFKCPQCDHVLYSKGEDVLKSDTCPNCHAAFVFSGDIQGEFVEHNEAGGRKRAEKARLKAMKKQHDEQKRQAMEEKRRAKDQFEKELVQRNREEVRRRKSVATWMISCPKCENLAARGSRPLLQVLCSIFLFPFGFLTWLDGRNPTECPKCGFRWIA